jgi:hypothetical protein
MGLFAALIENFFDGQALMHYENSKRLREALIVLKEKHGLILVPWHERGLPSQMPFSEERELKLREMVLEVNAEESIFRMHLAYYPYGIVVYSLLESPNEPKYRTDIDLIRSREMRADEYVDEILKARDQLIQRQTKC